MWNIKTLSGYQRHAARTSNSALTNRDRMLNAALGLCGEAGEASEHVKKTHFHGREFRREAYISELGDVLWYLAECCTAAGIDLEEVALGNIQKLYSRWPDGFNDVDNDA